MVKEVTSHLSLHPYAHNMTLVLNEKVEQHSHEIEQEQGQSCEPYKSVLLIGNQVVEHSAGNYRVHDPYQRNQQGRSHIERKNTFMRFIIT